MGSFLFALECVQRGRKLAQFRRGPRGRRRDSLIAPWKVALGMGVVVWLMITQGLFTVSVQGNGDCFVDVLFEW